jgi:hypothetical protein
MKKFVLKINNKTFHWHEQYITGAQVKELGEIPMKDLLFLNIKGNNEDQLIENEMIVDLGLPGLERFYSKEDNKIYKILVNADPKEWEKDSISFEDLVLLAFPKYAGNPNYAYTITYAFGPKENPEGSMSRGDVVFIKNQMKFYVTATNKS